MIPPGLLLEAYRRGLFPMAMEGGEIGWFSPDPRAIIPLEKFHVPHGLKKALRKQACEIRIDHSFESVIRACAQREDTWISGEIIASYCNLHRLGFAHSVEAWQNGKLAGGLYGVALRSVFFGESMFYHAPDASKIALHALVGRLKERGFHFLEIQWLTPHLRQFGAVEIPRRRYLRLLEAGMRHTCRFAD
jgi:leucyl/phenylalanyl-tRNA--protein transferase